jgi:hypothetical protein
MSKFYETRPGHAEDLLFILENGDPVDATSLRLYMQETGMNHLKGKHISDQLIGLGLYGAFLRGATPRIIPYTIWS